LRDFPLGGFLYYSRKNWLIRLAEFVAKSAYFSLSTRLRIYIRALTVKLCALAEPNFNANTVLCELFFTKTLTKVFLESKISSNIEKQMLNKNCEDEEQ